MSKSSRVGRLALLAAGGLLLAPIVGGGVANAATLGSAGAAPPTVITNTNIANELFGTTIVNAGLSLGVHPQFGPFGSSEGLLTFTLTNAQFNQAVLAANLVPFEGGGAPNCNLAQISLSSGGGVGQSTVTFIVKDAAGCENTADRLAFTLPQLRAISSSANVCITADFRLAAGGAFIDNNITNNASAGCLLTMIDANTGARFPGVATINPASGLTQFLVGPASTCSTTTAIIGRFTDTVAAAVLEDLATPFSYATLTTTTGLLTVSNIPASVTAVTLDFNNTDALGCVAFTGDAACVPAGGSCAIALTNVQLGNIVAGLGTEVMLTVNGVGVINPVPTTLNARLDVNYGNGVPCPGAYAVVPGQSGCYQDETKFDGPIGSLATQGCAVEYGSVWGAALEAAGYRSTFRIANVSNLNARLYAAFVADGGAASPAVQLTTVNLPTSAASGAWVGGTFIRPGSTIEVTGSDLAGIATANGATFSGFFLNRGRVRFFLETSALAGGSTGSLTPEPYNTSGGGKAGCVSESFICSLGVCSINKPVQAGTDGTAIAPPNR